MIWRGKRKGRNWRRGDEKPLDLVVGHEDGPRIYQNEESRCLVYKCDLGHNTKTEK